jgi:hypothetical protein
MKMRVAELWRYPVKSLAGEPLDAAKISADGIPGDRVVQVYDAEGRIVTSRTRGSSSMRRILTPGFPGRVS